MALEIGGVLMSDKCPRSPGEIGFFELPNEPSADRSGTRSSKTFARIRSNE
jgi:hypothetical protein